MSVNSLSTISESNFNESNFLSLNDEVVLNISSFLKLGNLQHAQTLIRELSKTPELIPVFKKSFSNELKDISLKNGVKKVIEIASIIKNTTKFICIEQTDIFDFNNPSILFWLMLLESEKSLINNKSRIHILEKYFYDINENDMLILFQNLEEMDEKWTLFKPLIKELVTFIFRNIEDNIRIKEKPEVVVQSELNYKFATSWLGDEYDYWSRIDSAWDTGFDMEWYVLWYDDVIEDELLTLNIKNDNIDLVFEAVSFWDDAIILSQIEELFDNVDRESHFYILLNYLKQNYFSIYKNIISDIRNFSINISSNWWEFKVLTTDSSRILHQRVSELLDLPPKEIEENIITTLWLNKVVTKKVKNVLKISNNNSGQIKVENESNDSSSGDVLLDDDNL